MKNYWLLLALLLFTCPDSFAQYSGKVFIDSNENGIYDPGEKLLQNVTVSDGLHVVLTDKHGQFVLPGHDREKFLFITTPSGYTTVGNYYHRIDGKEKEYNFPLKTWTQGLKKDGAHSFIQITDTEIFNTGDHEDWVGNLRKYAANEQTTFIIHTGDICYENGLKEHIRLMNSENMSCPVYYGIGNHDLVAGEYGEQLFESLYGPVWYSFEVGNTHYVMTPMPYGDHRPSYTLDEVAAWLKNDLAQVSPDKSIIVFNHDLLPLEKLGLEDAHVKAWLYGHWHINYMKKNRRDDNCRNRYA
ncbi:MAG: metallophosphoesterase, partial [Tannerellaceae bacterium]|nr:metallophosphoesterase [Tannerellaceae bacterium]